jgi:hypothetical protein
MTVAQAAPFAEHVRALRERLRDLTGLPVTGSAPVSREPTLIVEPGRARVSRPDAAEPGESVTARVDWDVTVTLQASGFEGAEHPEAGEPDPFSDEVAAAVLAVSVTLSRPVVTDRGGRLHDAAPAGPAGTAPTGEDDDGVSAYVAAWSATLSVPAALPPHPSDPRPEDSIPPSGIELHAHL